MAVQITVELTDEQFEVLSKLSRWGVNGKFETIDYNSNDESKRALMTSLADKGLITIHVKGLSNKGGWDFMAMPSNGTDWLMSFVKKESKSV